MKSKLILAVLLAASAASATIIINSPDVRATYDIADGNQALAPLSGVAAIDNTAASSETRFYAGTISTTVPAGQGGQFSFAISDALGIGHKAWESNWSIYRQGNFVDTGISVTDDLDFQLEVNTTGWGGADVSIYLGSSAFGTKGTADMTFSSTGDEPKLNVLYTINSLSLQQTANSGAVTISDFATGDEWVGVIPEPATIGMVAVFGGGILFIRRIFMV